MVDLLGGGWRRRLKKKEGEQSQGTRGMHVSIGFWVFIELGSEGRKSKEKREEEFDG